MRTTAEIHGAIAAVAPILGVSVGDVRDKSTWKVLFDPSATAAQRAAAQSVIDTFDVNAPSRAEGVEADVDFTDLAVRLRSATPAQIKSYVQTNVTDLASAKLLIAKILLVVSRMF